MMEILKYIWLLLPAGVANMVPPLLVFAFPKWSCPIDMGKCFRSKRILGDHKTWRGLIGGIIIGGLFFWLQTKWQVKNLEMFDYQQLPWYTGLVMGAGALAGDAIKSFFKRQAGVKSGKSWFPWDQIDWILGMIVSFSLIAKLTTLNMAVLVTLALTLHLIVKAIGYLIKINKTVI